MPPPPSACRTATAPAASAELGAAARASFHLVVAWNLIAALCFIALRNIIPLWFTSNAEAIALASELLLYVALYQLMDGIQNVSVGILRGIQDVRILIPIALVSYWLFNLPVGYLLGFVCGMGGQGAGARIHLRPDVRCGAADRPHPPFDRRAAARSDAARRVFQPLRPRRRRFVRVKSQIKFAFARDLFVSLRKLLSTMDSTKPNNGCCCTPEVERGCAFCACDAEPEAVLRDGCFKLHETPWLEGYPEGVPSDIFEVRFKNTRRGFTAT